MERLRPIGWLAEQTGSCVDIGRLHRQEVEAQRLHAEYEVIPTIGCEVEVKWSAYFPDLAREYFGEPDEYGIFPVKYKDLPQPQRQELDEICHTLDAEYEARLSATVAAGIPRGSDAYWEFANLPVYHWQTLATELELLEQAGLIPESAEHSLHITLGGATTAGGGMCLVLSGMELLFVPSARIVAATNLGYLGTRTAWDRRGKEGLRERNASVLRFGHTVGAEMRTLSMRGSEHAAWQLAYAQVLTTALLAFRHRKETPDPVIQDMALLWPQYRSVLKDLWALRGLPDSSWGSPAQTPEHWVTWSECLERRNDSASEEYAAIQRIHEIADKTHQLLQELT